ncbi:MAG: response regulator [Acidobacteriaceae bacterium]
MDDEEWIRKTLSLFAAGLGFLVRFSPDGLSALREIRLDQPEVLLADVDLPDMPGPQLLFVVRQRLPATLVIAMSGASGGRDAPSCIPADALYQKGSGPANLSRLLSTPPGIRRQTQPDSDCAPPLWIQHHPCGSNGTAQARITCPECHTHLLHHDFGSYSLSACYSFENRVVTRLLTTCAERKLGSACA